MKYKKIVINISIIVLSFMLFVIWHKAYFEKGNQTTSSLTHFYTVYLITTDKEYQYWSFLNQGAADMATTIGINYIWDAPAVRNTDLQIEVIQNAVNAGADALLVAADDPRLISGVIEDAKAKGIKIIYVDSPAYEEAITTLATDNYKAGVIAGQMMLSALKEKSIKSGSVGIISVEKKANSLLREQGFRKVLQEDGKFQILETIYTNGEPDAAREASNRIIQANTDIVGLYGTNEGTSEGVGFAIGEHENKIIGIGFDATDTNLKLLSDGSLYAIIVQNPYTMGYLGIAEAIAAIQGNDTGPSYIDTGVTVLKK